MLHSLRRMPWIASLALAAVLLRALVPTGFMPERLAIGNVGVKFCHGMQMPAGNLHAQSNSGAAGAADPSGSGKHSTNHGCAFAAVQFLGALSVVAALPADTERFAGDLVVWRSVFLPSALVLASHRPRGPPPSP